MNQFEKRNYRLKYKICLKAFLTIGYKDQNKRKKGH